jgi:hypothetical protein
MRKGFVATCVLLSLVCGLGVSADASTFDKRTYFTFSQPITLPGVTLPAGTYLFRLADATTGRKVVKVKSQNGMQSYAMTLSIPAERQDVPDEPEISFMETPAGTPAAVRTWWHQGERTGYELIYSREQKARLMAGIITQPPAELSSTTARSETIEWAAETESRVEEPAAADGPAYSDAKRGPAVPEDTETLTFEGKDETPAVTPEAQQGEAPAASSAQTETQTLPAATEREELPGTASVLPLASMLGLALAFGGLWLTRKN